MFNYDNLTHLVHRLLQLGAVRRRHAAVHHIPHARPQRGQRGHEVALPVVDVSQVGGELVQLRREGARQAAGEGRDVDQSAGEEFMSFISQEDSLRWSLFVKGVTSVNTGLISQIIKCLVQED